MRIIIVRLQTYFMWKYRPHIDRGGGGGGLIVKAKGKDDLDTIYSL